jgi:pyrroloquinoline quinone biosynthesis protein E
MSKPLALIAELTHRCPLHCVYCSNPLEMQKRSSELDTATWKRVFGEAASLGVLQLHLTGGEPLARDDLAELVAHGRACKLYVNLITSGVGLTESRLGELRSAGVDHVQLSFQDSAEASANELAGTKAHALKLRAAALIRASGAAFTMNLVIHRENVDRLPEMIALGEEIGADRLEIAHVQYYGWAFENRARLLPSREQVERSVKVIAAAKKRLKDRVRIDFVVPDYFAKFPKPCMGGWGRSSLLVDPSGRVLPCHSAMVIPGLRFENVRERPLEWIWGESESFGAFRGEAWMKEPCRGCDRRTKDFGGCRCQAFLLAGDAAATDPVCSLAPTRGRVDAEIARAAAAAEIALSTGNSAAAWRYRNQ